VVDRNHSATPPRRPTVGSFWSGVTVWFPVPWARVCGYNGGAMKRKPAVLSLPERTAYRRLEDVVGCKWSAAVLGAIGRGVTRPGQLERFIPGISTKVLNERLRKLLDYGLVERREFPGKVLRVEYMLTATGRRLSAIIEQIRDLDERHARRHESE
jgi:DNA-binding HxlR family transcriptional regulator